MMLGNMRDRPYKSGRSPGLDQDQEAGRTGCD
jgi:hypothetical protein